MITFWHTMLSIQSNVSSSFALVLFFSLQSPIKIFLLFLEYLWCGKWFLIKTNKTNSWKHRCSGHLVPASLHIPSDICCLSNLLKNAVFLLYPDFIMTFPFVDADLLYSVFYTLCYCLPLRMSNIQSKKIQWQNIGYDVINSNRYLDKWEFLLLFWWFSADAEVPTELNLIDASKLLNFCSCIFFALCLFQLTIFLLKTLMHDGTLFCNFMLNPFFYKVQTYFHSIDKEEVWKVNVS